MNYFLSTQECQLDNGHDDMSVAMNCILYGRVLSGAEKAQIKKWLNTEFSNIIKKDKRHGKIKKYAQALAEQKNILESAVNERMSAMDDGVFDVNPGAEDALTEWKLNNQFKLDAYEALLKHDSELKEDFISNIWTNFRIGSIAEGIFECLFYYFGALSSRWALIGPVLCLVWGICSKELTIKNIGWGSVLMLCVVCAISYLALMLAGWVIGLWGGFHSAVVYHKWKTSPMLFFYAEYMIVMCVLLLKGTFDASPLLENVGRFLFIFGCLGFVWGIAQTIMLKIYKYHHTERYAERCPQTVRFKNDSRYEKEQNEGRRLDNAVTQAVILAKQGETSELSDFRYSLLDTPEIYVGCSDEILKFLASSPDDVRRYLDDVIDSYKKDLEDSWIKYMEYEHPRQVDELDNDEYIRRLYKLRNQKAYLRHFDPMTLNVRLTTSAPEPVTIKVKTGDDIDKKFKSLKITAYNNMIGKRIGITI